MREAGAPSTREVCFLWFHGVSAWGMGWVYTFVMGLARYRTNARAGFEGTTSTDAPTLGPWGVYGEAIGNPKFYIGTNPKDSEFLQAADEFASAHQDLLRELAKR
jgi:hypothetical protein